MLKTGADGLGNLVYGALGAGSLPKPGQTVKLGVTQEIANADKDILSNANKQLDQYVKSLVVTTSNGTIPEVIAPELKAYAEKLGGLGVNTACGNTLGRCAEFRAANELLLSNPNLTLKDIKFTPAIRPKTGEVIPRCENCTNMFGAE